MPSSPSSGTPPESKIESQSSTRLTGADVLSNIFSMDLRSLAVFRIGVALVILVDLVIRASDMRMFYSDYGVLPRIALLEKFSDFSALSLHLLGGTVFSQAVLFLLAGFFAFGMLVGYRTRWMVFGSWILSVSLQVRNPVVCQGGDLLLRLLLFWSIFVPLGACYSVDSALDTEDKNRPRAIFSMGATALLLQIAFVYWFAAASKWNAPQWSEGKAVYYALNIDQLATHLGLVIRHYPKLMTALTYTVLWFEALGPFLLFMPVWTGYFRMLGVLLLIGLHVGFRATMELGPFPWISSAAALACLPTVFWEWLFSGLRRVQKFRPSIYYDGDCGFCNKSVLILKTFLLLPETPVLTAQSNSVTAEEMLKHNSWVVGDEKGIHHFKFDAFLTLLRASPILFWIAPVLRQRPLVAMGDWCYDRVANNRTSMGKITAGLHYRPVRTRLSSVENVFVALCLICVFIWNQSVLFNVRFQGPEIFRRMCLLLRLDQGWNMFAPEPMTEDGWYVIPGKRRDGTEIDLLTGKPVRWEKPAVVADQYPNERWRKYLMNICGRAFEPYRPYFGQYLCRTWNDSHPPQEQIMSVDIGFVMEKTLPNYEVEAPKTFILWRSVCIENPPAK